MSKKINLMEATMLALQGKLSLKEDVQIQTPDVQIEISDEETVVNSEEATVTVTPNQETEETVQPETTEDESQDLPVEDILPEDMDIEDVPATKEGIELEESKESDTEKLEESKLDLLNINLENVKSKLPDNMRYKEYNSFDTYNRKGEHFELIKYVTQQGYSDEEADLFFTEVEPIALDILNEFEDIVYVEVQLTCRDYMEDKDIKRFERPEKEDTDKVEDTEDVKEESKELKTEDVSIEVSEDKVEVTTDEEHEVEVETEQESTSEEETTETEDIEDKEDNATEDIIEDIAPIDESKKETFNYNSFNKVLSEHFGKQFKSYNIVKEGKNLTVVGKLFEEEPQKVKLSLTEHFVKHNVTKYTEFDNKLSIVTLTKNNVTDCKFISHK